MMKVFIGGSRRIKKINDDVKRRLDKIVNKRLPVIIGDANGADKAVQEYFWEKKYHLVEVFCSGGRCRNNIGHWPVRMIPVKTSRKDFSFYATKDRAMADEATVGFMLWDKESAGTLMNVQRLIQHHKKIVIFIAPEKRFIDIKNDSDWSSLLSTCPSAVRERIKHETSVELVESPTQPSLFGQLEIREA